MNQAGAEGLAPPAGLPAGQTGGVFDGRENHHREKDGKNRNHVWQRPGHGNQLYHVAVRGLAIVHGLLSWLYVIYFVLLY